MTSDVNTYQIQIPFMINTAFLMYYFYKAWKTDSGIIETSRDEKVRVSVLRISIHLNTTIAFDGFATL